MEEICQVKKHSLSKEQEVGNVDVNGCLWGIQTLYTVN